MMQQQQAHKQARDTTQYKLAQVKVNNQESLVQRGAIKTVFNPFPRRHLEPSPSECGRQGGPSHKTQKSSGIGPPRTRAGAVCDRVRHRNPIISVGMYIPHGESQKIISVGMYIPHGESQKNISVRMYITHSSLCGNVCARWPNANSSLPEAVCDCQLIEHAYFLETVRVV